MIVLDANILIRAILGRRVRQLIENLRPAGSSFLRSYGVFEDDARKRLRGRDEDDWPVLASALCLGCAIWTEDEDFFGTGIAVWTTNRVEIFFEQQVRQGK